MYQNTRAQIEGLRISSATPADDRLYFETLTDLESVDTDFPQNPYRYYEGMVVYVLAELQSYIWVESTTGILASGGFTYMVGFNSNEINYGGRTFNFVLFSDINNAVGAANNHIANSNLIYDGNYTYTLNSGGDSYWEDLSNNKILSIRESEVALHKDLIAPRASEGSIVFFDNTLTNKINLKSSSTINSDYSLLMPSTQGEDNYRTPVAVSWIGNQGQLDYSPTPNTALSNFKSISGTSYTISLAEEFNKQLTLLCENALPDVLNITVPNNANQAIPVGFRMEVIRTGHGVFFVADTGVTLLTGATGFLGLKAAGDRAILHKIDTNTWVLNECTT